MKFFTSPQNSPEWFVEKNGVISSSRVGKTITDKIMNKTDAVKILLADFIEEQDKTLEEKELKKLVTAEKKRLDGKSQIDLESSLSPEVLKEYWHESRPKEYYRLLAEQLGYFDNLEEDPRDRGHRLEDEASQAAAKILGVKPYNTGFIVRDDYPQIGLSPDRVIPSEKAVVEVNVDGLIVSISNGKIESAFEIKSPGVANHLEICMTNTVPSGYWDQVIQYFVVGDVERVYFISYNPLVIEKPIHIITIERKDVEKDIEKSLYRQIETINHLKEDLQSLTF